MAALNDPVGSLAEYLTMLAREELIALLGRRPESGLPPAPASMRQLAERLSAAPAQRATLPSLTRPELQAAEAAAALGDGCPHAALAALLGVPTSDPGLRDALDGLARAALVWPQGDALRHCGLAGVWPSPLLLGPPATVLLAERTVGDLRDIARRLDIAAGRAKADIVRALVERLSDHDVVRQLAAQAPAPTRKALDRLAWEDRSPYRMMFGGPPQPVLTWAVQHGLISAAGWSSRPQMPAEVALALRGRDYQAPFDPVLPKIRTAPVATDAVRREAAAAATAAVAATAALAEATGRTPVTMLKTGGIGVREVRRLAKLVGEPEHRARLLLEVIGNAGLIAPTEAGVAPTEEYDKYAANEPAEQLLDLLDGWLNLPACPLRPPVPGVPASPVLAWDEEGPLVISLRSAVLRAAASLPPGVRLVDRDEVTNRIDWERPLLAEATQDDLPGWVEGIWREAHELGLLAHDAATDLCRRLLDGDAEATREQAAAALPDARISVVLQADLTAVVTGVPSVALAALLDGAADQESRSGAWTWRFSPASVRRALDAGVDPNALLARLTEAAAGGRVPQPLDYLITDVARRYGHVAVRPVGCCLRSDDTALLTEIMGTRSLAKLGLTALAPTVLASTAPVAETLAALRAAGYAPANENADGSRAVELAPRHRAVLRPSPPALDDIMFEGLPDGVRIMLAHGAQDIPDEILDTFEFVDASDVMTPDELATILVNDAPKPT